MLNAFSRTRLLLGKEAMERLALARVAVFGVGGVGGYTAEGLARAGVGALDLIDDDRICLTNINRQIIATRKTVGQYKTDVMAERVRYDYVVDAIDTVKGKIALVMKARAAGTPIISALGAGNKLDPTAFEVADLAKTSVCPLARVMRRELGRRGVKHLKVVYSKEQPLTPLEDDEISCKNNCVCPPDSKRDCSIRRQVPGSVSFVPSVMGLIIAGEVVRDLVGIGR